MWAFRSSRLTEFNGLQFFIDRDGRPAACSEVLVNLQADAEFRNVFNDLLAGAPFAAYRWETPALTRETLSRPFEFVLLNSPSLTRAPDAEAFAAYFRKSPAEDVVTFSNLGGDAILVVPRPLEDSTAYVHLASFVREAPESQRHSLWQAVGNAMSGRIGSKPVWLSTAGGGVAWLHVRLDDRPKYYGYGPYRQFYPGSREG